MKIYEVVLFLHKYVDKNKELERNLTLKEKQFFFNQIFLQNTFWKDLHDRKGRKNYCFSFNIPQSNTKQLKLYTRFSEENWIGLEVEKRIMELITLNKNEKSDLVLKDINIGITGYRKKILEKKEINLPLNFCSLSPLYLGEYKENEKEKSKKTNIDLDMNKLEDRKQLKVEIINTINRQMKKEELPEISQENIEIIIRKKTGLKVDWNFWWKVYFIDFFIENNTNEELRKYLLLGGFQKNSYGLGYFVTGNINLFN